MSLTPGHDRYSECEQTCGHPADDQLKFCEFGGILISKLTVPNGIYRLELIIAGGEC